MWENVAVAIAGGVVIYVAILLYLIYRYLPKRALAHESPPPASSTPPP